MRDTRLRGISDEHRAIIDSVQPYRILRPRGSRRSPRHATSNHDNIRLLHVLLLGGRHTQ